METKRSIRAEEGGDAGGGTSPLEFDVPDDETPAARCPHCDRPFRSERYLTLHVGVRHPGACSDERRESYESAREDEEYDLFTFHVKATVAVLLTYFAFAYFYAMVWSGAGLLP